MPRITLILRVSDRWLVISKNISREKSIDKVKQSGKLLLKLYPTFRV